VTEAQSGLTAVSDPEMRKLCTARNHISTAAVVNIFEISGEMFFVPVAFFGPGGTAISSESDREFGSGNAFLAATMFSRLKSA